MVEVRGLENTDNAMIPAAKSDELLREYGIATENEALALDLQKALTEQLRADAITRVLVTLGSLGVHMSEDQLKDYVERFFLKQDGYDDP